MATVRAAETLLRARGNRARMSSSTVSLTQKGDDGVRIIRLESNVPVPD